MNNIEKIYSVFAVLFAFSLLTVLTISPELRVFKNLIIACLAGMVVNIGLLFIVLKDIFTRPFTEPNRKYFWLVMVLLVWPSILYYVPKHGFKPKY